jgi:hypothetical protein
MAYGADDTLLTKQQPRVRTRENHRHAKAASDPTVTPRVSQLPHTRPASSVVCWTRRCRASSSAEQAGWPERVCEGRRVVCWGHKSLRTPYNPLTRPESLARSAQEKEQGNLHCDPLALSLRTPCQGSIVLMCTSS